MNGRLRISTNSNRNTEDDTEGHISPEITVVTSTHRLKKR